MRLMPAPDSPPTSKEGARGRSKGKEVKRGSKEDSWWVSSKDSWWVSSKDSSWASSKEDSWWVSSKDSWWVSSKDSSWVSSKPDNSMLAVLGRSARVPCFWRTQKCCTRTSQHQIHPQARRYWLRLWMVGDFLVLA